MRIYKSSEKNNSAKNIKNTRKKIVHVTVFLTPKATPLIKPRGSRGRDCMVVGFITTYAISLSPLKL
jgi:hypothetical protein